MLEALLQFISHLCAHPLPRLVAFLPREPRDKATTEGGGVQHGEKYIAIEWEHEFIKSLEWQMLFYLTIESTVTKQPSFLLLYFYDT